MRKLMVRNDGPPDYEWIGSFDDFQTEFSVSRIVEEKLTSDNKQMDAIALCKRLYNYAVNGSNGKTDIWNNIVADAGKIAQQHH